MFTSLASLVACGGGRAAAIPAATPALADAAVRAPGGQGAAAELGTVRPTGLVPPPHGRKSAAASEPPAPLVPWTAVPAGSTTQVFREVLVGRLPGHALRNTWWLIFAGRAAYLRLEEQHTDGSVPHLDRTSHDPDLWSAPTRTEYVGRLTQPTPSFTLKLQRHFGTRAPAELTLVCAPRPVAVHPAFATLVEGWKNDDETMEPAAWAPPRTERVSALGCKFLGDPPTLPFGEGLAFASGKTTVKLETAGLEWAFVNSDMVIQEGGYRWIPRFSLAAP